MRAAPVAHRRLPLDHPPLPSRKRARPPPLCARAISHAGKDLAGKLLPSAAEGEGEGGEGEVADTGLMAEELEDLRELERERGTGAAVGGGGGGGGALARRNSSASGAPLTSAAAPLGVTLPHAAPPRHRMPFLSVVCRSRERGRRGGQGAVAAGVAGVAVGRRGGAVRAVPRGARGRRGGGVRARVLPRLRGGPGGGLRRRRQAGAGAPATLIAGSAARAPRDMVGMPFLWCRGVVQAAACPACDKPLTVDLSTPSAAGAGAAGASGGGGGGGTQALGGRAPRKTSILSRIPLSQFQSSTKIEVRHAPSLPCLASNTRRFAFPCRADVLAAAAQRVPCSPSQALREEVHRMVERDASSKALVFSQFTSMLDLCQFRLEQVRGAPRAR